MTDLSYKRSGREAIDAIGEFIVRAFENGEVLSDTMPRVEGEHSPKYKTIPDITDELVFTLPITKRIRGSRNGEPGRCAVNQIVRHFLESSVFFLEGEKIVILIGGDPNTGKSTLAASLYGEIKCMLESLNSRGGLWEMLNLKVGLATLDAATPVADVLVRDGVAQKRAALRRRKRPWSLDLAGEAIAGLEETLKKVDICIVDLPGKVDDITGLLAAYGTHAIIVGPPQDAAFRNTKRRWGTYFAEAGMAVVAQIKSTRDRSSIVSDYKDGKAIYGRIRDLARVMVGWDPFIQALARFLLFDILPKRIYGRYQHLSDPR